MADHAVSLSASGAGASAEAPTALDASATRRALAWIVRRAWPWRWRLALAFATSLPLAALGGVMPWALKEVTELFRADAPFARILFWLVVGLAAMFARSLFEIATRYIMTTLHTRLTNNAREELFARLHEGSLAFHLDHRAGELASLVSNDAQAAASGVIELHNAAWESPVRILILVGVMFWLSPWLALLALGSLPVLGLVVAATGRRARVAEREFLDRQGRLLSLMIESLTNVKQVKAFDLAADGQRRFAELGDEIVRLRQRAVLQKSLVSPASELTNGLVLVAMAALAWFLLSNEATTPGAIVGCLAAAFGLRGPARAIARSVVELQRAVAAIQRIDWIAAGAESAAARPPLEARAQSIAFDDVAFSYDGRRDVLAGLSFEIRRGERLAVVGPSGAGKTTLVDLLIGFYPCSSGRVVIDGRDLADVDPASWRRQVGVVTQEPFLFDGSIEDNIRHGWADATDDDVRAAASRAGCDEILDRLGDGLQSRVGERGSRLSGGERKRVALARALVRPISTLILDEATSELDAASEAAILDSIDELAGDLIVIHVSHRPSVLAHCDRALTLEDGTAREADPAALAGAMRDGAPRRVARSRSAD